LGHGPAGTRGPGTAHLEEEVSGHGNGNGARSTAAVYRLEVEGRIGPEWAPWFGAVAMECVNGHTVLELMVADQSELHGLLRRVHDLHLPLVSLSRLAAGEDAEWQPADPPVCPV
jgi:hypothetical protein